MARIFLACLVGLVITAARGEHRTMADDTPTVDQLLEIEKRVLETRRAITCGQVCVSLRHRIFEADPSVLNHTCKYTLYFDGDRLRCDWRTIRPDGDSLLQTVSTKDVFIRALSDEKPVQFFGPLTKREHLDEFPDPLRLGLVVWNFHTLRKHGFERHFLAPDRYDFIITSAESAGETILKVVFHRNNRQGNRVRTEYWLAPQQGHLPIYIEVQGDGVTMSIKCALAKYENGGIWYPREVVYRYARGDKTVEEEVVSVESAVFGECPDKDLFTLAGLGLAKGRIIDHDGRLMTWTGERMIPQVLESIASTPQRENPPAWQGNWFLMVSAIVLAVIATGALWLRWRSP
jgi:hypothetical protein